MRFILLLELDGKKMNGTQGGLIVLCKPWQTCAIHRVRVHAPHGTSWPWPQGWIFKTRSGSQSSQFFAARHGWGSHPMKRARGRSQAGSTVMVAFASKPSRHGSQAVRVQAIARIDIRRPWRITCSGMIALCGNGFLHSYVFRLMVNGKSRIEVKG